MTQLHAYFNLRNQQAFQRLLDGSSNRGQPAGPSTSGGRSWNRRSPLSSSAFVDVNARDWLGRSVLHLAASSQEPSAIEYVRLLLAHPDINVNLPDKENHWTALHRAAYHGNVGTAVLLLQRPDIDTSVKDNEGYTAYNLYNSTVEGTQIDTDDTRLADLFTWGANRNAALGLGNGDDRLHPEQVVIRAADGLSVSEKESVEARFSPIHVQQVAMSKLHTVVVTAEDRGNLRLCGFGSGGRLGPGQHTQYSLVPLPQLTQTIIAVALGQDHTLALSKSGEVFSWGLNRFSQLGYVIEPVTNASGLGRSEEPIQATARKVTGTLKNKVVAGVAACKIASACWTESEVFTWGTNNGQLGYDKSAQPVQVLPRVVTKISQPVISITITDTALACVLATKDVVVLCNDGHFKVNFPAHAFPSEITAYRPPQAINNASIEKITGCDNVLAALTSNGELFTLAIPPPTGTGTISSKTRNVIVPQRVWALRKKFSAVRDVALSTDGSIVICTESGHVFVRQRNAKAGQGTSAKAFKFQQVPYLQRVVRVCANETGAYGALRIDHRPSPIEVRGHLLAQDLAEIQPYIQLSCEKDSRRPLPTDRKPCEIKNVVDPEFEEEVEDITIQHDIEQLKILCSLLQEIRQNCRPGEEASFFGTRRVAHGPDLLVQVQRTFQFPAHRVILAARSTVLAQLLSGGPALRDHGSNISVELSSAREGSSKHPVLSFSGCQTISLLLLLVYFYSDNIPALWDRRVGLAVESDLVQLKIKPAQVKLDLHAFAGILNLPLLAYALEAPVKRMPASSMVRDMQRLFKKQEQDPFPSHHLLAADTTLCLGDRNIYSYSSILRARSSFFADFFNDSDWTANRRNAADVVVMDLKHLRWRQMEFVVRFLCCGEDEEMFEILESVKSTDELIDFMFEVIAAANELLVDRLILLCSNVILKCVSVNNASSILAEASHFHILPLVRAVHEYIALCMETLLESRMLDDLEAHRIRELSSFIRQKQVEKYPVSRSDVLVRAAMETYGPWLASQDIPQPIVPTQRFGIFRDSPRLSPPGPNKRAHKLSQTSPPSSPSIRPEQSNRLNAVLPADEEMFVMDDVVASSATAPNLTAFAKSDDTDTQSKPASGWKAVSSTPKMDMRAIMAEAQSTAKRTAPGPISRVPSGEGSSVPQRIIPTTQHSKARATKTPSGLPRAGADSPWRVPPAPASLIKSPKPSVVATSASGAAPGGASTSVLSSGAGAQHVSPFTSPKKNSGPPGMGPVFTPSKQTTPTKRSSGINRVS
ncbi:uncharacterized protein FIBRA_07824 [Fibroporia radiculosa]|uniref:BTB domain-containing protein n=1 Tax=Fibroporia radiculosa TaxID=599839 RepID=J4IC10_9APHY|nr:uncharacterized protein FIBRA_07824 [Fibroporia radiculosa]CCM05596.1 predicted protein [Fibroporia radiculosa]